MKFFNKNFFNSNDRVGIDISDNSIKFAQVKNKKNDNILQRIGSLFLPEETVEDGRIKNEEELKNVIKEAYKRFNLDSKKIQRKNLGEINDALSNEEALIIFPAAEVSRLKYYHISDSKWHKGAIHFAKKNNAPLLPVFINARNSLLFYLVSGINKYYSRFLLAHELFNKKNKIISIKIGNPIPADVISANVLEDQAQAALLKKHVYRIGKNKRGIFKTERNIIHPVQRKFIKRELLNSEQLGETADGKKIF